MPAFYMLFALGVIATWFILREVFKPFGEWIIDIIKETKDIMSDKDEKD